MEISAFSPSSIWASASRTLTNVGPAFTSTGISSTSIAGNAAVDLRPGVGLGQMMTIAVTTGAGAAAGIQIGLFDGAVAIVVAVTAAAPTAGAGFYGINGNTQGFRLQNADATHAGSYLASIIQMVL